MVGFLLDELTRQIEGFPAIFKDADLVLGASLVIGAPTVAEYLGIPYGFVAFCPQVLPSHQHPSVLLRHHNLPWWLNRLSWKLDGQLHNILFRKAINKKRGSLGLQPVHDIWPHFFGQKTIVASDPVLAPVPPDVRQDWVQVGYLHLYQERELGPDLEAFLSSGPPPVYAGFGSMPEEDPETITALVLKAARATGQRVILFRGWASLGTEITGEDYLVIDDAPNASLFSRVCAVVHHGGSGTTATAARAGVPQIIIPHILDQYYWGSRVNALGIGPKPLPRSILTAGRLVNRLREVLFNRKIPKKAQRVAKVIQQKDSLAKAVRIIESEFLP
jgi:UDP:flavonoid glycosyltransferase YjiC (YdhE family)